MNASEFPSIRLTVHAGRRALERDIEFCWIIATIAAPDWTRPGVTTDVAHSFRAIAERDNRISKVVYRPDGAEFSL